MADLAVIFHMVYFLHFTSPEIPLHPASLRLLCSQPGHVVFSIFSAQTSICGYCAYSVGSRIQSDEEEIASKLSPELNVRYERFQDLEFVFILGLKA